MAKDLSKFVVNFMTCMLLSTKKNKFMFSNYFTNVVMGYPKLYSNS